MNNSSLKPGFVIRVEFMLQNKILFAMGTNMHTIWLTILLTLVQVQKMK
jgi:hypothetical protein